MGMQHWRDAAGRQWKEIVSRNYWTLVELRKEYEKRNRKTWLEIFDRCEGSFVLTVLEA